MAIAVPNLPASSLIDTRSFYVDGLGFKVLFDTSGGGEFGLLGLERDGMRINIDAPMDGHGRQACASFEVEDVDGLYREWSDNVKIDHPPVSEAWGARTFGLTDPAENTLFVLQWDRGGR